MKRAIVIIALVAVTFAAPATGLAQSPANVSGNDDSRTISQVSSTNGRADDPGSGNGASSGGGATSPSSDSGDSGLAFTGIDLAILVAAAVALGGAGILLRRAFPKRQTLG